MPSMLLLSDRTLWFSSCLITNKILSLEQGFPIGPPMKIGNILTFFVCFFAVHGKNGLGWPKWGREVIFPANPDLADILGDMDFDFDIFF